MPKAYLLSDFDGVINAPTNHIQWTQFHARGEVPDPHAPRHPDRPFNPELHYTTDGLHTIGGTDRVTWSSELVDTLRDLHNNGTIQFMWASGWREHAVAHLNPLFQFDPTITYLKPTSIPYADEDYAHDWKIPALIEHYNNLEEKLPLIWLDDLITEEFTTYPIKGSRTDWLLEQLQAPDSLIIHTDERFGITREHMRLIQEFTSR